MKFWSGYGVPGSPFEGKRICTLRRGVRHVLSSQGLSVEAIDRAERAAIAEGLVERCEGRAGLLPGQQPTLRLTPKGAKVACQRAKLSPWTDEGYPGAGLYGLGAGASNRRRRDQAAWAARKPSFRETHEIPEALVAKGYRFVIPVPEEQGGTLYAKSYSAAIRAARDHGVEPIDVFSPSAEREWARLHYDLDDDDGLSGLGAGVSDADEDPPWRRFTTDDYHAFKRRMEDPRLRQPPRRLSAGREVRIRSREGATGQILRDLGVDASGRRQYVVLTSYSEGSGPQAVFSEDELEAVR